MGLPQNAPAREQERIKRLFDEHQKSRGVKIDLGCGANKQPGFIGVDFRKTHGVDIEQDLTKYPWRSIPDNVADVVMASHVLEHINPDSPDPRLAGLLDLLLKKNVISKKEVDDFVGEYRFLGGFVRFMDEVWRITKPGGQFLATFPYADSAGFWQDPTHVNGITEITMAYFDPFAADPRSGQHYHLYTIYRPKPWKLNPPSYSVEGGMEVLLEKRVVDKSYQVAEDFTESDK